MSTRQVVHHVYLVVRPGCVVTGPVSRSAFAEDVGVREEIAFERREVVDAAANRLKVIGECSECDLCFVDVLPGVDVVEEVLVIGVLLVPLDIVIVAEIVANESQHDIVSRERARFGVLLQQHLRFSLDVQSSYGRRVHRELCNNKSTITHFRIS